jgi:uncharacterized protein GlcG (DUF336 family)
MKHAVLFISWALLHAIGCSAALAESTCPVSHEQLQSALRASVKPSGGPTNGGFDNHEWAAVVNHEGIVCAIAFSGAAWDDQWLGSRAISAEKAFTAAVFSLKSVATSTANLFWPSQPGGILYGLITSNPIDTGALYAGKSESYGTANDPLIGHRLGGTVAFGGGLPLYRGSNLIGGIGASGDTSCADHNIAWRLRKSLAFDQVPKGISGNKNDGIIYDVGADGRSESGFGHPKCKAEEANIAHQIGASSGPSS